MEAGGRNELLISYFTSHSGSFPDWRSGEVHAGFSPRNVLES